MAGIEMLQVKGARTGYGSTPILQGMEFTVNKGEIVAIIGRNGVGKSTLMKCLIGLLPCNDGSIWFNGGDVTRAPAARQRGISTTHGRGEFVHGQFDQPSQDFKVDRLGV
jgi:ABC-type branched-subunit amino acid transport system ATPase component